MTNQKIPFVRIIPPLVGGIIVGIWISPTDLCFVVSLVTLLIATLISSLYNKSFQNTFYGIAFSLTLFVLGLFLYTKEKQQISILEEEETIIYGILNDYPIEKENTYQMTIRLSSKDDDNVPSPISGSLLIYHNKNDLNQTFRPGDILVIRLTPREIVNRGNPYEFDYKAYMERQKIRYYAFTGEGDILFHDVPNRRSIKHTALIVRQHLIDIYKERGIGEEQLPLIAAITLGQKALLDPDQKEIFSKAGIMHIMAVSGLHAGIVSMLAMGLLFFLKGRLHFLRVVIAIVSLWAFAFITGLTPSVTRASLMFSFLHIGLLIKRPVNNINSILASAFFLIVIHPSVIFESGFQLSYLAVIYIICLANHFSKQLLIKNRIINYLWQSTLIALIAQIGTLPLTITLFNRFPTCFLLTNIFIIPIATAALICGLITLITCPISFVSSFVASLTNFLVKTTETLTYKTASLPFSTIDNIGMTTTECIMLLITIALISRYITNRKKLSPILPLCSVLLFLVIGLYVDLITSKENKLIVYNTTGYTTVGIQQGKKLYIFSNDIEENQAVKKHASTLRLKTVIQSLDQLPLLLECYDNKILIIDHFNDSYINDNINIFIVTRNPSYYLSQPNHLSTLILSNEVRTSYYSEIYLNPLYYDTIHNINGEGAFMTDL